MIGFLISDGASGRWESVVGQISLAVDNAAIAASHGENILRFNARRRVSHVRLSPATRPRSSAGVVVRFPLAAAAKSASRGRAHREDTGRFEQRRNAVRPARFRGDSLSDSFCLLRAGACVETSERGFFRVNRCSARQKRASRCNLSRTAACTVSLSRRFPLDRAPAAGQASPHAADP